MGAIFNQWHLDLAAAIRDTQVNNVAITASSQDGLKRSSAQRSQDLTSARYWMWGLFRIKNKKLFFFKKTLTVAGVGIGYADITALNITNPEELTLLETSLFYGKPVAVVDGDELAYYQLALSSYANKDIMAGLVSDISTIPQKIQLKIILGSNLQQQNTGTNYVFELGYYANPVLEDLTSASTTDVTEPRAWHDAIKRYAEHAAWKLTGNTEASGLALQQAYDLAKIILEENTPNEKSSGAQQ